VTLDGLAPGPNAQSWGMAVWISNTACQASCLAGVGLVSNPPAADPLNGMFI